MYLRSASLLLSRQSLLTGARLLPAVALLTALLAPLTHSAAEAPAPAAPVYVRYVPPARPRPVQVLVALHGFGDRGEVFSNPLVSSAREEGWVLVAPTFQYGDWRNPTEVAREDTQFVETLRDLIARLPDELGVPVQPRVLLYGFSRGAQLAHRFTLVHPDLVQGVALLSAGTYTLPLENLELEDGWTRLAWPYGCSDFLERFGRKLNLAQLRTVPFMVGVGELDNNPTDLPRQWDRFEGRDRVERARAFANALVRLQVPVRFLTFPREGHASAGLPSRLAMDFLTRLIHLEDEPDPRYDRALTT